MKTHVQILHSSVTGLKQKSIEIDRSRQKYLMYINEIGESTPVWITIQQNKINASLVNEQAGSILESCDDNLWR